MIRLIVIQKHIFILMLMPIYECIFFKVYILSLVFTSLTMSVYC